MKKHVVILAGGSGTRLWPASRAAFPKQFLDIGTGRSLFQECLERSLSLEPSGRIVIVTHSGHVGRIREQWEDLPAEIRGDRQPVILPEPVGRNTAPALAYAASQLEAWHPEESTFTVLASDHKIDPANSFRNDVVKALKLAESGHFVTFGIPPSGPNTGYGYIEIGQKLPSGFNIKTFHEKPDRDTAERYLKNGGFFWNSGLFVFPTRGFLGAMGEHAPEVMRPFGSLTLSLEEKGGLCYPRETEQLGSLYSGLPSISIDYALMEKVSRAAMVPASFNWSDVGSWDEAVRFFQTEKDQVFQVQSDNNFVFSDLPVALAGVKDLIVIVRNGAVLICRKGSSQLVRDIVDELKGKDLEDLL